MSRIDRFLASDTPWPADAGLETVMIFLEGIDLPHFASFPLLETEAGRVALTRYFDRFLGVAQSSGTGLVLDTATWRANMGWAAEMGMDAGTIRAANRRAVGFAVDYRKAHETAGLPILINGVVGPAGDGYRADAPRAVEAAEACHAVQIAALAGAGVDMISALTMTHPDEAIGIARAARAHGVPHVLSFTVETDGRLPDGTMLPDAIARVDAETAASPLFYMVNCAHPSHFSGALHGPWVARIGGVRANASRMSHAELDEMTVLDDGNPEEFGAQYRDLGRLLPNLRLIGGCCGSDHRHVAAAMQHFHPHPA